MIFDVELSPTARRLHSRAFRYRRLLIWLPSGLVYACFYQARYAVAVGNISAVRDALGLDVNDFGLVIAASFWAYGFTGPVTGRIADALSCLLRQLAQRPVRLDQRAVLGQGTEAQHQGVALLAPFACRTMWVVVVKCSKRHLKQR